MANEGVSVLGYDPLIPPQLLQSEVPAVSPSPLYHVVCRE